MLRPVELLAPAADFSVAKAAIDAGADAVYIGGPAFGARVRASNSLQDIEKTVRYAHRYAARVFLTLNTLVYEEETPAAVKLARQAYEMGVDALLIQDLGLLEAGLPPIELHASTQCHIDSVEKALFLQSLGFRRLVLARELSLKEIEAISKAVDIETEAFIHGALCVSYSGQCYMSCHTTGRSGNRGECSQSCRLPYDLVNGRGEVLLHNRYLLSMKDLNADAYIEDLVRAGVSCLKIEGRLKEVDYVKNVTYWYRKRLDEVLKKIPLCGKASQGEVKTDFQPDLQKTFHREYTTFNLLGKREDWAVFETPKAMGCRVGMVRKADLRRNKEGFLRQNLQVEALEGAAFATGDGVCYVDACGDLQGGHVERVEKSKGLFLLEMAAPSQSSSTLPAEGTALYRNRDKLFDKALQTAVFARTLAVHAVFDAKERCFYWCDEDGNEVKAFLSEDEVHPARKPDAVPGDFAAQMGKLGGTAYRLKGFEYKGDEYFFVPVSVLNRVRRELEEKMDALREKRYCPAAVAAAKAAGSAAGAVPQGVDLDYRANCANRYARRLYSGADAVKVEPAYELEIEKHRHRSNEVLMLCKHCIRAQTGQCLKRDKVSDRFKGDLFLRSANHKFALRFDCEACRMEVRSC